MDSLAKKGEEGSSAQGMSLSEVALIGVHVCFSLVLLACQSLLKLNASWIGLQGNLNRTGHGFPEHTLHRLAGRAVQSF